MTAPTELDERAEIRRRVRNIYGAISSNQVTDKDVEGQAKRLLEYIDALPASEAGWRDMDEDQVDRAAKHLRETLQSAKRLTVWEDVPRSTKKKWLALAKGTLLAALPSAPDRRPA